jgi:hypothetical protein
MNSNLVFQKREKVRLVCCVTCSLRCIDWFTQHGVKICRSTTLVTAFLNVKTAGSPKRQSPTRLHGNHNRNFEMYLRVWTMSSFNVQDVSFVWTVSSILFVVRLLEQSFQLQILLPAHMLGAIMSSGSNARIKWTSCYLITFGVGLAFVDKAFVQRVA